MNEIIDLNHDNDAKIVQIGTDFADIYTKSLTNNTKRAYLTDILDFFNLESLENVTIDMIQNVSVATANQYVESLIKEGKAPSTINRKLTALSNFYTFLCRHEIRIMDYNPFSSAEGTKRLKANQRYSNTRCLTIQEISNLVKAAMENKDNLTSLRNIIIILLLSTTGMRRSEIVSIKIKDITIQQGKNVVEILGKGNKQRYVVISDTIKVFIDKYLSMRKEEGIDNEYLLISHTSNASFRSRLDLTAQTVYNVVREIATKANINVDNISPHCLRHSFATESINLGIDLKDIQDMMGHADMTTTRRYDHTNRVIQNSPAQKLESIFLGGIYD